jgi:hypothetical protein|nr:MAG TPA_asm: hypothetical protein [Caudoviricetes sp.]
MAKKNKLIKLEDTPILKPIDIDSIGSSDDPCFGKAYDLSTQECRSCGDSELCCIKFAEMMGKTRKELEEKNQYKDMELLVDKVAAKKTFRALRRKGEDKKTIIQKLQAKYSITIKEARTLYREFTEK